MTKVAGILIALIVVGVMVTTRTHTAAGPVCPATSGTHPTSTTHTTTTKHPATTAAHR